MAAATGISPSSVLRVWRAHKLRPHRVRTLKLSKDPAFVAKLRDELKFSDLPALTAQMHRDAEQAREILSKEQHHAFA